MNEINAPQQYDDAMRGARLKEQGIKKLGVAVFVVDLETEKIWTVRENVNKSSTRRTKGVLTIPLETRKVVGKKLEWGYENVIGALDEFRDLQNNEELIIIGFESDKVSSFKGRFAVVDGVAADIVILGLRNKSRDNDMQARTGEVEAAGWKTLDELMQNTNLREGIMGLLRLVKEQGWLDETVKEMLDHEDRVEIMNNDLKSSVDREKFPDMELL